MRPGDHLRLARFAVAALAGLGALALPAQVVPVTPPPQAPGQVPPKRPPPRTAEDSAQARRDSLKALPLVHWALADSVGLELLQRKGYQLVRYQAEGVRFGANERTIVLTGVKGERAAVQREPTVLVSDTIVYSDTSSLVAAAGESIFRDPTRGGGDVTSSGKMRYSLNTKVGVATRVNAEDKAAGQDWFISAQRAGFAGDSSTHAATAIYGRDGTITTCEDSVKHYDFSAREIKRVSGSIMVARSVVMHIMDVPVMWFPFIFQDARDGRRSGILTPRFGITELFRNSPTYRRNVENIGYYFALSDYYDAQMSLDWRSSAKATDFDPGWVRLNGAFRYRLLDWFVAGGVQLSRMSLSTGSTNTLVTWQHQQDFSIRSHLTVNFNYASNTTVQRQTVINPLAVLATIASTVNYQRDLGVVQMSIGGTQRQYPGRAQVDRDFPSLNITSKPLNLAPWLVWTPSFNVASSQSQHLDSQGDFSNRFITRSDGTLDSVKVDRSTRTSSFTFNTPIKVFDSPITLAVRGQDRENDFPELRTIVDPVDTTRRSTRVYARTYLSTVDFDINFSVPQLVPGAFHVVPSVSLSNVNPGAYFVRSERTGARWESQSKRLSYGLGISPTFFGFFRGLGVVEMFRHAVTPTLTYSYSPAASVSTAYLAALGQTPQLVGNLAQNRVTLSITQYIEAKLRAPVDSNNDNPAPARKIKVLSLNFTPLTWDFERARQTHKTGFANDNFGYTLQSELLPGFDFGADYSLFQGSVLSDSAKFSPYLVNVRASFTLDAKSPITHLLGRLLGVTQVGPAAKDSAAGRTTTDQPGSRLGGNSSVASEAMRSAVPITPVRGFEAQLTFSKTQQRPPVGGNVIQYDPTLQCLPLKDANPIQYDFCLRNAQTAPPQDVTNLQTTAGGTFIRLPPQTNIQSRTNFNLTEKWAATWSTNYDVERHQFGSQTVSLQRELHDWRAVFGFTQAPNGNFAFTFYVSLKAEPDIKFDYNRSSYRLPSGTPQP